MAVLPSMKPVGFSLHNCCPTHTASLLIQRSLLEVRTGEGSLCSCAQSLHVSREPPHWRDLCQPILPMSIQQQFLTNEAWCHSLCSLPMM